jgi:hypothetical protein
MLIIAVFSSTNISSSKGISLFVSAAPECVDGVGDSMTSFMKRKNNQEINICVWAARGGKKLTKRRCKKRKRIKGKKRKSRVKNQCPCTCLEDSADDFQDGGVDTPPSVVCPSTHSDGEVCLPTYQDKLGCEYDYMYIGCTWAELKCVPTAVCTCNSDVFLDNKWACAVEAVDECPKEPREERPIQLRERSLLRTDHHDTDHHHTGEEEHLRRARRRDLTEDMGPPGLQGSQCNPLDLVSIPGGL